MSLDVYVTLLTTAYEDKIFALLARNGYSIIQVLTYPPKNQRMGYVFAVRLEHEGDYEDVDEGDEYEVDYMLSDLRNIFNHHGIKFYSMLIIDSDGDVRWLDSNIRLEDFKQPTIVNRIEEVSSDGVRTTKLVLSEETQKLLQIHGEVTPASNGTNQ